MIRTQLKQTVVCIAHSADMQNGVAQVRCNLISVACSDVREAVLNELFWNKSELLGFIIAWYQHSERQFMWSPRVSKRVCHITVYLTKNSPTLKRPSLPLPINMNACLITRVVTRSLPALLDLKSFCLWKYKWRILLSSYDSLLRFAKCFFRHARLLAMLGNAEILLQLISLRGFSPLSSVRADFYSL